MIELKDYEVVFVEYVGYNYDSDTEPLKTQVYRANRVADALRQFRDDYPGYSVEKINIITGE